MKEIIRITIALTVSCLLAAFFMGMTFIFTAKAKKHNHHANIQETMFSLLGYNQSNPAPSDLKLNNVYRYIIEEGGKKSLGYVVPVEREGANGFVLVVMNLDGSFVEQRQLSLTPEIAMEDAERNAVVAGALAPAKNAVYADGVVVAIQGGKKLAYLLPGFFPGFKTFIHVVLALNTEFGISGLEIMEHEEDPGLGAEIGQEYFKNQFKGKTFEKLRDLNVIKEPIPDEYLKYLETKKQKPGMFTKDELQKIFEKYRDKDIYALTGATISSKAVSDGVKGMAKKFAYRIEKLQRVLQEQGIPATV